MATTVARLQAVLSADTRDFDRGMRQSESRMKKVGTAAKVGLAVGVGAAIVALKARWVRRWTRRRQRCG